MTDAGGETAFPCSSLLGSVYASGGQGCPTEAYTDPGRGRTLETPSLLRLCADLFCTRSPQDTDSYYRAAAEHLLISILSSCSPSSFRKDARFLSGGDAQRSGGVASQCTAFSRTGV